MTSDTSSINTDDYERMANQLELANESLAQLELAREDAGWDRLLGQSHAEFTRAGFTRSAEIGRVLAIGNPMTKRALALRHAYVWGQGVGTTARATGEKGEQDVNTLVQEYLDDEGNRAAFTGAQAAEENEKALGTDGNVFLVNFTNPLTGRVRTRTLPFDEIDDIIFNPDDRSEPWLYKRVFVRQTIELGTGKTVNTPTTVYYPALRFRPQIRPRAISGAEIMWDAPVYHVKANALKGWKYGLGDVYASAAWVKAYKEFLESWSVLMKSLSRIAWQFVADKRSGAQSARQGIANMSDGAGQSLAIANGKMEAVPKSGATLDSESGRPLAAMAAAGFGVPVTMLLADPGVTGARATAATLDFPTRLEFGTRRELWTEARRAVLGYVIDQAVIAPTGPLKGTVQRDGEELIVTLAGDTDRTLDIVWPDLDDTPIKDMVEAIVNADSTQKIPPLVTVRMLLRALRIRDVDEILEELTDDDGNFVDPQATAGRQAMQAFRDGRDPNQRLDSPDGEIEAADPADPPADV